MGTRSSAARPLAARLADVALGLDADVLPADVAARARHCLLDWVGVTLAGSTEPLARIVHDTACEEGGRPEATVLGRAERLPAAQAAWVNGAAGHALDYDDVIVAMQGHPTVAVAPVVFALGEKLGTSGRDAMAAFVAGVEVSSRLGAMIGPRHYEEGFHATGTLGAFAAAATAARLMGLSVERTAHALGIAATQASGLKGLFGTMCKPLHAGHAAAVGARAAALAARGFEARTDAIECVQGFAATHHGVLGQVEDLGAAADGFHLRGVLFKYHASCYGTHAAIEAARALRAELGAEAAYAATRIVVTVPPAALRMCAIPRPTTGLEAKFSLSYTVAAALAGVETAALGAFDAAAIAAPASVSLCERVELATDERLGALSARVRLEGPGGFREVAVDASRPEADLDRESARLEAKFVGLSAPVVGAAAADEIAEMIRGLAGLPNLDRLASRCRPTVGARRSA